MSQPLAPGAFAKALQDKRRGDRKRRWVLWGSIVGAVVLIGAAIYLFGFSPVFATHNVQVNGTSLLTEDEVREAAQVQLELPVLREDTGAIAERVRQLKPVRDVAVGRALPDTIVINVTERTLSYQVKEKDSVSWVDTEGVIYNTSAAGSDGVIQVSAQRRRPVAARHRHGRCEPARRRQGRHRVLQRQGRRPDLVQAERRPGGRVGQRGGIRAQGPGAFGAAFGGGERVRRVRAARPDHAQVVPHRRTLNPGK